MPYIDQNKRLRFTELTDKLEKLPAEVQLKAGDLNYLFTVLCKSYLEFYGSNYQTMNDMIGALEGCKLEIYRRIVGAYEDKKIISNGDVFAGEPKNDG